MGKIYRFVVLVLIVGLLQGCGEDATKNGLKGYDIREYIAPIEDKTLHILEYASFSSSDPSQAERTYFDYSLEYKMASGLDFNETLTIDSFSYLSKSSIQVTDINITKKLNESSYMPDLYSSTLSRYANISDTVSSSISLYYKTNGEAFDLNTSCVLTEHLETLQVSLGKEDFSFDDVLKLDCSRYSTTFSTSISDVKIDSKVGKSTVYYAKYLGPVYSVANRCIGIYEVEDNKTECSSYEYNYYILDQK